MAEFSYKPGGDTLKSFMLDVDPKAGAYEDGTGKPHFFRGLRGPVGSGKSACCCVEIFRLALRQRPGPDGKRKSRWAIVRNSYPELRTTTINTWKQWFPEDVWGPIVMNPPPYTHRLRKGDLDLEILFLALDRPEDVRKLLSLELTGVWVNEAREVPKTIIDAATSRVGRYPSMKDGGPSWYGVICDTNAPDEDHWWGVVSGEVPVPDHLSREEALLLVKPDTWHFFSQPGGMIEVKDSSGEVTGYKLNPKAENLKNLTPDYYPNIVKGKGRDWVNVYVLNKLGSLRDGKPVYPEFDRTVHVASSPLQVIPHIPIVVGVDFGLTPAAVIGQNFRGRWQILRELVAQDMGIVRFAQLLRQDLALWYPDHFGKEGKLTIFGDPAGDYRAQTDETTPFQIMRNAGLKARPAPGNNDVILRTEAVRSTLVRSVDKAPGLLIDPGCTTLVRGFDGGYQYRRLAVSGAERFTETPDKNKFSHVHDAAQYMMLGGGEGRDLVTTGATLKPVVARAPYDPFDRKTKAARPSRTRFV